MTTTASTSKAIRPTYREMRSKAEEVADERIKENVLRGLELLYEQHGEDWVNFIDPAKLDLRQGASCVLGQVYFDQAVEDDGDEDGYNIGVRILGIEGRDDEYGFSITEEYDDRSSRSRWDDLQEAWDHVFSLINR